MEKNQNKLAVLSIIVEDLNAAEQINALLHENAMYVKGRMGLPEVRNSVAVICVVIDAPQDIINGVTGKIGMINGVKAKTLMR